MYNEELQKRGIISEIIQVIGGSSESNSEWEYGKFLLNDYRPFSSNYLRTKSMSCIILIMITLILKTYFHYKYKISISC